MGLNINKYKNPLLDSIFTSELNILVIIDDNWTVLEVNNIFPGLERKDVIGKYLMDLVVDPLQKQQQTAIIKKAFKEQKEFSYESAATFNNKTIYYLTTINPIIENGESIGATLLSRDISEEKSYKENLLESEKSYRELVEHANSIVLKINNRGYILYANNYALDFFQFQKDELIGHSVIGTILPETDSQGNDLTQLVRDAINDPMNFGPQINENRKKDGSIVWVSWGNYPEVDEKGELIEMLTIGNDITLLKNNEKELFKHNQLLEQAQQSIINVDLTGHINYLNIASERFFAYSKAELLGQHISILYPPEQHKALQEDIIEPLLENGYNKVETIVVDKNGNQIDIELQLTIIRNEKNEAVGMTGYSTEITERKVLEARNHLLATIVQQGDIIIGVADLKGNPVYANAYAKEKLGMPENFEEMPISEYLDSKTQKLLQNQILPIVFENGQWTGETSFVNRNTGKKVYGLANIFVIKSPHSYEPEFFAIVSTNINELKSQTDRLLLNERRLITAQKVGKIGSWELDINTSELLWSAETYRIFGVDENSKITYDAFIKLIHPDDRDGVHQTYHNHLNNNTPYDILFRIITSSGVHKYINARGELSYDQKGKAVRSFGVAHDLTELKETQTKLELHQNQLELLVEKRTIELRRALKELHVSESKYKILVESTSMGIVIAQNGTMVYVNKAFLNIFGYEESSDLLTKSMFDLVAEEDLPFLRDRHQKVINGEHVSESLKIRCLRKDGAKITCQLSVRTIIYEGVESRHASFLDITDLQKTQENLKKSEEKQRVISTELEKRVVELKRNQFELEKAKRIAEKAVKSKDEFFSIMSHEIRTPLNSIIGLGRILEKKEENASNLELINILNQSSANLMSLINDLLDFSKIQANKVSIRPDYIPLKRILEEVFVLYQHIASESNLSYTLEIDASLPENIIVDALRLKQILNNLVSNAFKFTKNGFVKIIVKPSNRLIDEGIAIDFVVKDSGVGVSKSDQSIIFNMFEQGKVQFETQGGSGLGLAIVKNLAHLMGGEVDLHSEEGKGAEFTVSLPLLGSNKVIVDRENSIDKSLELSTSLENKKILYVEDVYTNQFLLRNYLNILNIECQIAENGKEALNMLKQQSYDLICMDVQMPDMDGYQATELIKNDPDFKHIPIIGFTADTSEETRQKIFMVGMDDLITKPIDFNKFHQLLEKHLDANFPHEEQFNFGYYESIFGSDQDNMATFYNAFRDDIKLFMTAYFKAMDNANITLMRSELHKISSIVLHLENKRLNDNFTLIEEQLKEKVISPYRNLMLKDLLNDLLSAMSSY